MIFAGVDEAGRGPLAGPVVASAVILDKHQVIQGLDDSKKLTEAKRELLFTEIQENAKAIGIGIASVQEIDQLNILQATLKAMQRAVSSLKIIPDKVIVDGNQCPNLEIPVESLINGDALLPAISAASIIAKVTRDNLMLELDHEYPEYGFKAHKGYGTRKHLDAIAKFGVTPHHRLSFAPVKRRVEAEQASVEAQGEPV